MYCRILCCFIAKFLFYAIYAVLLRNLFCRDLRALAWRKIGPTILSVEKKGQISGMNDNEDENQLFLVFIGPSYMRMTWKQREIQMPFSSTWKCSIRGSKEAYQILTSKSNLFTKRPWQDRKLKQWRSRHQQQQIYSTPKQNTDSLLCWGSEWWEKMTTTCQDPGREVEEVVVVMNKLGMERGEEGANRVS